MSNTNFQEIVKRLKRSVEEQKQRKSDIPVEDQLKVVRQERERQIQIDQEYQRRKENAAKQLHEGMKELRDRTSQ
ncbi:hypothetical protein CEE45_14240 [Candidatus Heimdallarchaeota archaeon B3_Heim]|nr:MAG: hypothetical protein CEE45_14240 [Candidatus Heimdallarchaeota archaeon B3_Heim]